jgi:hypothetical protein
MGLEQIIIIRAYRLRLLATSVIFVHILAKENKLTKIKYKLNINSSLSLSNIKMNSYSNLSIRRQLM